MDWRTFTDWRGQIILMKLREGCTLIDAAATAGISRRAVTKRRAKSEAFNNAVIMAREVGKEERTYRIWLRHPFRGRRPPSGKGHGGKPRFTYGRR